MALQALPSTLQRGQATGGPPDPAVTAGIHFDCWVGFWESSSDCWAGLNWDLTLQGESLQPLFLSSPGPGCPRLVWTRVIRAAGILLGIITNSLSLILHLTWSFNINIRIVFSKEMNMWACYVENVVTFPDILSQSFFHLNLPSTATLWLIMAKIYCLLRNNELMKFFTTTGRSQPSNKSKFADFWRDLWVSPETCLEITPPSTTRVNPPGNLAAVPSVGVKVIFIALSYQNTPCRGYHLISALILQMTMLSQLVGGIVTPRGPTTITGHPDTRSH